MRRIMGVIATGAAATWLILATPAVAEPVGLDCMAASYTSGEQATIEQLSPKFGLDAKGNGNQAAETLAKMGGNAAQACADKSGWTSEELLYASLFEIGRLSEHAFRISGIMPADQLEKLDGALAKGDRDELWAAIERSVMGGMTKTQGEASAQDTFAMGAFLLGAGVNTDHKSAENTGILLGFMALQRIGRREFSALQKGK